MDLNSLKNYRQLFLFILKYYDSEVFRSALSGEAADFAEDDYGKKPEELVEDLKKMGPVYIKLGQLLSTRPDLLPEPYLKELSKLQDDVETLPFETVEQIFQQEIGTDLRHAFQQFEQEPLASASIGQVHRALLPSGRPVAVKIQRPGIQQRFLEDLETLQEAADFAVKHSTRARQFALSDLIAELRHILLNELDYRHEAQNLLTLRKNLRQYTSLIIPAPVEGYCTSRVLTMDYIDGKKITSVTNLRRTEVDFTPLIDDLVKAYMQQIVVDGFAHADPHPGNVHLTADNRIALMDLGMVAKFNPGLTEKILLLLAGLGKRDGDAITDALLDLAQNEVGKEEAECFRQDINRVVKAHGSTAASDLQTGRVVLQMTQLAAFHNIHLAVELNILGKILLNLDQIIAVLTPDYDLQKAIGRFLDDIVNKKMWRDFQPENLYGFLLENKRLWENLPSRLNKITERLAANDLELRIHALDEKRLTDGFQKVANRITSGLIIAAMIIGAALLMRIPSTYTVLGYGILPFIFFVVAIGLGLYLVYNILFKDESFGGDKFKK